MAHFRDHRAGVDCWDREWSRRLINSGQLIRSVGFLCFQHRERKQLRFAYGGSVCGIEPAESGAVDCVPWDLFGVLLVKKEEHNS